ncbi:tRNA (5-methylaminomethyl-2-thiouridine)(34)-methyltransferase MnmD [Rhodohalobacter sp. SW132]|uniref:tRNA (5-methylaminomethyl-2-thiouridine)(34)-methyltransferase MnmD n=1 Tax=Rhodohalobacter sp. SW132 TaxID=2293433 RepID=UPI001313FE0C|nr:tRNA (5-methylaminomethyl-2-thiouridine)(34)-methyltransferase MnmD [Rhodohalobacter sp. SW132]
MGNQIKKTGDGSDTLVSDTFNQPYHSLSGAVSESRIVYFESTGLDELLLSSKQVDINLMEIGFGTGMNLVLLLDYLGKTQSQKNITFCSVEAYPVGPELVLEIDFGKSLSHLNYREILKNIFSNLKPGWNTFDVHSNISLNLFHGTFTELSNPDDSVFDYIMHDPFSPDSNPAGWTADLFAKLSSWSSDDAMLSTYSAATSARAAMAAAGWKIARAPGALGKREMTVASINPEKLSHLKRVNEKRLIERFKDGEFG